MAREARGEEERERWKSAAEVAGVAAAGKDGSVDMSRVQELLRQFRDQEGEIFNGVDAFGMQNGLVGCAVCGKHFHETDVLEGRHEVKVLSCFHSVCAACLQSILSDASQDGVVCPLCRHSQTKLALHEYLPHFEAHSVMDRQSIGAGEFFCEECVQGGLAEAYCEDCQMHMCGDCQRQHRRAKATVQHSVVSVQRDAGDTEEASNPREVHRAQYCAIHRAHRYEFYCEECDMLVCQRCVLDAHQSHVYKLPTQLLIERQRARIQGVVEGLCAQFLQTQSSLQQLVASGKVDELRAAKVRANVEEAFDQLDIAAESRCADLSRELHSVAADRRQGLDAEKSECAMSIVDIWRTIDFMEKLVTRGTDVEVMLAKTELQHEHASKLQHWRELTQRALPGPAVAGRHPAGFTVGWRSSAEAASVLDELAAFGQVLGFAESSPLRRAGRLGSGRGARPPGPDQLQMPRAPSPRRETGAPLEEHVSLYGGPRKLSQAHGQAVAPVAAAAAEPRVVPRCSWADLASMDDEGEGEDEVHDHPKDVQDVLMAWYSAHT